MEDMNNNNDFLMKFGESMLDDHPNWSQPDHSQGQIGDEFDSNYKDIMANTDNCFGNKLSLDVGATNLDNLNNLNNLSNVNMKDEILPNFEPVFENEQMKDENVEIKEMKEVKEVSPVPTLAPTPALKTTKKASEARGTKRARIKEEDIEAKEGSRQGKDLSLEKKKELNRKSASQCRKRRKEYVEQLEKRVDTLENEVHCLKRKLKFYEQNEKLEALSQKESILQYLTGKYDEYDNLDNILKSSEKEEIEDNEINKCINTIKIRQGSQGFVRKQTVNYLLKKVIEKIVPGHVKYILASCANENGYFEKARGRKLAKNLDAKTQRGKYVDYAQKCQDPENHIWKEIIYTIGLNSEEIKLLKKQRAKILKYKEKFSNNLSKFLKIKKEMFHISAELEKILDDVGKNVKPIQLARFLKYVDKIKHRKEIDVFHLWGVKSNKFRVRKDKIGTQDLLSPSFEKVRPTYALVKKKEKKIMKEKIGSKIDQELQKNKLKFESTHGKMGEGITEAKEISPEEIAKEILGNDIKQVYKEDVEELPELKFNLNQNPACLYINDSEDSGLPDSACDSKSSSDN